ncbi:Lipoprotein [Vibrio neptunius]|uniref:hypothetical protein n=1 Tax=Vibrio neptunius TaxID=170651 RepID=UPI001C5CC220|nr:hypothetical protein [Vibrio neptunius]QXX07563.1 hypothetical protein KW548_06060 [Vibrio neptunius]
MKTKHLLFLSISASLGLTGCGGEANEQFKVNSVTASDFAYTMANQPAVDLQLQQSENNFCQITLLRSNVKEGFTASLKQQSTGSLSSSCYWNGNLYIQSSKHPTIANLKINKIDETNQSASFTTSLKLVNNKTLDSYFEIKDVTFTVAGQQYTNLTTIPSE